MNPQSTLPQDELNRQLIDALAHNDDAIALALVNSGADPNTRYTPTPAPSPEPQRDPYRWTALLSDDFLPTAMMFPCGIQRHLTQGKLFLVLKREENLPMLQAMLENGAQVNAIVSKYGSALNIAVMAGRLHTADLLLQHGAEANIQMERGHTPLMWAVTEGMEDMTRLLLAHGADPNVQGPYGHTSLHYAVMSHVASDVIPSLQVQGADLNLSNDYGHTPLQWAQKLKRPHLLELLRGGVEGTP